MTTCELYYFIGKCLSLGEEWTDTDEVVHLIQQGNIDWEKFLVMVDNNLVVQTIYCRFNQHKILSYIPNDLAVHLKMIYDLNAERNLKLLDQINRINRLLATAGIIPIYLKSTGNILDNLYEDIGEKMFGDIDLLVSDSEFLMAVNLLRGKGYEQNLEYYEEDLLVTKHYPRLIHSAEPADVEVHRIPVELTLSDKFNYNTVKSGIKKIETVPPCFVLSDQDKLIMNVIHGFLQKEVRQSRFVTYRNMLDFMLLEKRVNISDVFSSQPKLKSQVRVYADFVHHVMGTPQLKQVGIQSRHFIWRNELFLKSEFIYKSVWLFSFLFSRLWSNYIMNMIGVFFSNRIRKSIFRKISDPTWYNRHRKFYIDIFNQNLIR